MLSINCDKLLHKEQLTIFAESSFTQIKKCGMAATPKLYKQFNLKLIDSVRSGTRNMNATLYTVLVSS